MRLTLITLICLNSFQIFAQEREIPDFSERNKWKKENYYVDTFSEIEPSQLDTGIIKIILMVEQELKNSYKVEPHSARSRQRKSFINSDSVSFYSNQWSGGESSQIFYTDSTEAITCGNYVYGIYPNFWNLIYTRRSKNILFVDNLKTQTRRRYISFPSRDKIEFSSFSSYLWTGRYFIVFENYWNFWYLGDDEFVYQVYDFEITMSKRKYKRWLRNKYK